MCIQCLLGQKGAMQYRKLVNDNDVDVSHLMVINNFAIHPNLIYIHFYIII